MIHQGAGERRASQAMRPVAAMMEACEGGMVIRTAHFQSRLRPQNGVARRRLHPATATLELRRTTQKRIESK
jgi:hypothetical protein